MGDTDDTLDNLSRVYPNFLLLPFARASRASGTWRVVEKDINPWPVGDTVTPRAYSEYRGRVVVTVAVRDSHQPRYTPAESILHSPTPPYSLLLLPAPSYSFLLSSGSAHGTSFYRCVRGCATKSAGQNVPNCKKLQV